ncbi:hypothetical protein DV736_g4613, partial [Chaetothyriales sp. CBS 134916]
MPSDIQVFVRFQNPCVFAGEELRCTITFKNAASLPDAQAPAIARPWANRSPSLNLITTTEHRGVLNVQNVARERTQREAQISSSPASTTPSFAISGKRRDHEAHPRHRAQRSHPRNVSQQSQVDSERSSGDFYSLSNVSQETLMSEQPSILSDKPQIASTIDRQQFQQDQPSQQRPQAANLLMGYAHLNATFTVDGSLVNQAQFEEVKQKGFLGGQAGGGVVGVKKARPKGGFLGGFNFNSLGESLNTLMAGNNMSSVKEMNQVTNSRAVPLLSTPQTLLFVDLHLEPGDEKTYSFKTTLPRGLPSSYKGKAIRISYNILVGVQGVPGGPDVHKVRQISVPVRVFSGVDNDGAILGHDLFQPQVILKDASATRSIDPTDPLQDEEQALAKKNGNSVEFLKYVDTLLDRHRRRQSSTGTTENFFSASDETPSPSAEAINRAILLSSRPRAASESSTNRFEIARNGLRVAIITIDRALHRLGETVTAVIDFSDGQLLCSSLHGTLETTEKVSSSLAVRSTASIDRVTRRIYASHSENILCSKRSMFAPTIPANATPSFVTSGINLNWSLRFEFGTVKPFEQDDSEVSNTQDLFEDVVRDERGVVSIAVEKLECETFEIVIPITVYGDIMPHSRDDDDVVGIPI